MRTALSIAFGSALLWMTSCAGPQATVAPAPAWVLQSPVKPGYYIGIGSASKLVHPLDAEAVAKQNALDNLSREIRVQVQSTNTTNALQVNGWLSESFAAESRSTTNEDLEGFTLVDTYATESDVLVYYELNKAKHAQLQETKRRAALNLAWGQLQAARSARSSAQVQQAVDAAIRGLDAVRPFMDRPMMHVDANGAETAVPDSLIRVLDDCMAGLQLAAQDSVITLVVEDSYRSMAHIKVFLDDKPAPNVGLSYRYKRSDFPTRGDVVTDANGVAHIVLEKFEPGIESTMLEVNVDAMSFVHGLPLTHPFRQAANGIQSAPLRVRVELAPVELALVVEERAFGKKRDQSVLLPALKEALQEAHVVLRDEADMALTVQADTRPGGSGQGFTTVYADVVGTVTNQRGETLYTKTLTSVKGIQLDLLRATDAAYGKASEEMSDTFVPGLIRVWHGL
ncbi:MAG: LPP20 family lipoprotein [Bacteroidota bacterium]|nr:LPP20 family lipoprotein [Bacteroidota bacterium]